MESEELKGKLELLVQVSQKIEDNSRVLQQATHPVMAEQVGRQVDSLTKEQEQLMEDIVNQHPEQTKREEFAALSEEVNRLRVKIQLATSLEKLEELNGQIQEKVDAWVLMFQQIVAGIMKKEPPSSPQYSEPEA